MARQRTSINVNAQLWRRFKSVLALEGKDMSPVIEYWIEQYLDAHEQAEQAAAVAKESL
jgi:metal-responsive CopG/Arc/MetJ family transcriptional regulator